MFIAKKKKNCCTLSTLTQESSVPTMKHSCSELSPRSHGYLTTTHDQEICKCSHPLKKPTVRFFVEYNWNEEVCEVVPRLKPFRVILRFETSSFLAFLVKFIIPKNLWTVQSRLLAAPITCNTDENYKKGLSKDHYGRHYRYCPASEIARLTFICRRDSPSKRPFSSAPGTAFVLFLFLFPQRSPKYSQKIVRRFHQKQNLTFNCVPAILRKLLSVAAHAYLVLREQNVKTKIRGIRTNQHKTSSYEHR